MRLERIRLEHVRAIDRCDVAFDPQGVTIVEAPNEQGKSTLIDAVHLLLDADVKDNSRRESVRSLTPVGRDVASTIEVTLLLGGQRVTFSKTFNRETATSLRVEGAPATTLSGDDAHQRFHELVRSSVDADLLQALWLEQGRDLTAPGVGTPTLAERLDAVAGGGDAGPGEALLARAEEAYARWFTPGRGQPRGDLVDGQQRVEELAREVEEVTARLASLDRDVDELASTERELPDLERRLIEQLRPGLDEATRAASGVASVRERRDARAAEYATAQRDAADAEAARARRADLIAQLERAEREHADAVAAADADVAETERLAGLGTDLDEQLALTRERLRSAGATRERLEHRLEHYEAHAELERLRRREERMRSIVDEARLAEDELATISLDEAAFEDVRAAATDLRRVEAEAQAGAARVCVRALDDVHVRINDADVDLAADDARDDHVSDVWRLQLDGVLDIEVHAATSPGDTAQRHDRAREALTEALKRAGVSDEHQAEEVARRRLELDDVLQRRDDVVERELDGMSHEQFTSMLREAELRATTANARLEALDADRVTGDDGSHGQSQPDDETVSSGSPARALRDELEASRRDVATLERDLEDLLSRRDEAAEVLAARRREQDRLDAERERLVREVGNKRDDLAAQRADVDDAALDAALAETRRQADEARQRLDAAQQELNDHDPDAIDLALEAARNAHDDVAARVEELTRLRIRLRERLDTLGAEGLGERRDRLDVELQRARAALEGNRRRAEAARLLRDTLVAARDAANRSYRDPLRKRVVAQARLLFDDEVDVEFDTDLRIVSRTLAGVTLQWGQLSAGAREQLAILTGVAAAEIAGDDGVPLVLDDALGYTDPERMARLGALLGRVEDAQVIVLTCVAERFAHARGRRVALADTGVEA